MCKQEQASKFYLGMDCYLKFNNMKTESLVIADHHAAVNLNQIPVHTARHTLKIIVIGRF